MGWLIKYEDKTLDSDDLTIEELGEVERVSGTPWSIANPFREVKVARAFIAVLLLRNGLSQEEVARVLRTLTLRKLRTAFEYREDPEALPEEPGSADPLDQGPTSPGSSPTGRRKGGPRAKRASSG